MRLYWTQSGSIPVPTVELSTAGGMHAPCGRVDPRRARFTVGTELDGETLRKTQYRMSGLKIFPGA